MTTFFTSDHHFWHSAIIQHTDRPFTSVEEMNADLISKWNSVVRNGDIVYHLGDFALCGPSKAIDCLKALNGFIRLIPGGHDKRWLTPRVRVEREGLLVVEPPILTKKFAGKEITLCHWPMRSWEKSHYGALHFHGHTHGTIGMWNRSDDRLLPPNTMRGNSVDVSVELWGYKPVALEYLLAGDCS